MYHKLLFISIDFVGNVDDTPTISLSKLSYTSMPIITGLNILNNFHNLVLHLHSLIKMEILLF